jgi:hypothetical protein
VRLNLDRFQAARCDPLVLLAAQALKKRQLESLRQAPSWLS